MSVEKTPKLTFMMVGASNHTSAERDNNDFYATEPRALTALLEIEEFDPFVWECSCGAGHLSEVLREHGYIVRSTDLVDRGYGEGNVNFLECNDVVNCDIITNPPFKYAQYFVEHALEITSEGNRIAMFLKLTFLETKARRALFEKNPPELIYVSSSRLQCAKGGDFKTYKTGSGTAIAYAWFIWRKGFKGETRVRWFN